MATLERTVYPRFPEVLAPRELQACYTPLSDELEWARRSTRGERPRLGLLVLLKVFQQMHYFPPIDTIPTAIVDHVRAVANIGNTGQFAYDTASSPTLFRHYIAVRVYLNVKPYYGTDANAIATRAAHTASLTMDQPVDIINADAMLCRATAETRSAHRQSGDHRTDLFHRLGLRWCAPGPLEFSASFFIFCVVSFGHVRGRFRSHGLTWPP